MSSSLCKLNVQVVGKSSCLIFDALVAHVYPAVATLIEKGQVKWASNPVKGQINPFLKCLFMEMFSGLLKRLEIRLIENCVVQMRRVSEGTMSYILDIKWLGCYSEVRRSWHIPKIDPSYAIFSIIILALL